MIKNKEQAYEYLFDLAQQIKTRPTKEDRQFMRGFVSGAAHAFCECRVFSEEERDDAINLLLAERG